jgi:hypothetical protein
MLSPYVVRTTKHATVTCRGENRREVAQTPPESGERSLPTERRALQRAERERFAGTTNMTTWFVV